MTDTITKLDLFSYYLNGIGTSEHIGGVKRAQTARRDRLGRFMTDEDGKYKRSTVKRNKYRKHTR